MTPEQTAERLKIDLEELFRRAYSLYGLIYGGPGPIADLEWYRRWHNPPLYVLKFCTRWDKIKEALNGQVP